MALLDEAVSQLLVELSRTVKGQNGVEFYFQSIYQLNGSLIRENSGLLGLFPQFLGLSKIFLKFFFL